MAGLSPTSRTIRYLKDNKANVLIDNKYKKDWFILLAASINN